VAKFLKVFHFAKYSNLPLLRGALQMLAREINWKLFFDEQANQVITA